MNASRLPAGLYGIADAEASNGDPERLASAFLDGGARIVQLRCKGWAFEDEVAVGRRIAVRCEAVGAWLIGNDDPHRADAMGAHGLHLGQLDGPIAAARSVMGTRTIGRSTHSVEQALQAQTEGADYIAFGPCYATPHLSRPKPVRGIARLTEVAAAIERPLVAIGGITVERLAEVRAAGAHAWAIIGAVAHADDPIAAARELNAPY